MSQRTVRPCRPRFARARGAVRILTAALAVPWLIVTGPARPAGAAPACPATVARPSPAPSGATSWPARRYQLGRLAGIADGTGVIVAVLDSGVDADHPRLRGRVLPGADELAGTGGRIDCVGHGTAVASIIAAVAPGAGILPVRVTEREVVDGTAAGRTSGVRGLAAGIRWAVDHGADVLNLSLVLYDDDAPVREAIRYAHDHDVVIVAAVGNRHGEGTDPVPYPAAYPGVLGVAGIGPDGRRAKNSPVGSFVDIAAPGVDVLAAAPGQGNALYQGTSFAAPFVAGTAALLRQERPGASVDQVGALLRGSADPGPPGTGAGVVDPYRAATEVPVATSTRSARPPLPAAVTGQGRRPVHSWILIGSAVGVLLAGGVLIGTAVVRRGRARGWHTGPLT